MNLKWTEEQWRAITGRKQNLLVAAGAGAGKTAVLVERIIRHLLHADSPLDIDRLLVVTFTNAAAAEMRERVGRAIDQEIQKQPANKRLSRQAALLGRASIATLHSFCLDLLRRYFYLLDLDPAFRVADATEAELLKLDVLEGLFEEKYLEGHETFLHLVDAYGGSHGDNKLQDTILELHNYAGSHPQPEAWLSHLPRALQSDHSRQEWLGQLGIMTKEHLTAALAELKTAIHAATMPNGPDHYLETLENEREQIDTILATVEPDDWDHLCAAIDALYFARLPGKRGGDPALRKRSQGARNEAKAIIKKINEKQLAQSKAQFIAGLEAAAPAMELLCQLTVEFRQHYTKSKRQKGLVDFNDLEHLALAILQDEKGAPSTIALELRQQYREVLVDEYQDINGVQEAILRLVADPCGQDNQIFMVGDVKQSIYRFRLADPTLFLDKYHGYAASPETGQRIDLIHNFRSRSSILEAVNFLFRQLMTEQIGELSYDRAAALQAGASYPANEHSLTPEVELALIERTTPPETESDAWEELDASGREARLIAQEIRHLVESGKRVWDKDLKAYRAVKYSDIVVLLRASRGRANTFMEQLAKAAVPAYADLNSGYFQATEIQIMMSLLRIIDNPRQDIPLAAVLRSPLAKLSGAELAEIRLAAPGLSFYEAVRAAAQGQEALAQKIQQFLSQLELWRLRARRHNLSDLIWQIYRDSDYYAAVGAMPGGAQRQANLRALHDRARQYEATAFRGLFRFLRFIERLESQQGDLGMGFALGENENVVRIMSIHKSKGLEFPIVFLAGLGNRFNLQDLRQDLLIHKDMGLGPMAVDFEQRLRYPTLPRLVIEEQLLKDTLSEELRVLYVALTRAKEKLYLSGSVRNLARSLAKWGEAASLSRDRQGALPTYYLADANCFLDWIMPALAGHPQAAKVWAQAGIELPPLPSLSLSASRWSLQLIEPAALATITEAEALVPELENVLRQEKLPDHGFSKEVAARLGWEYPRGRLRGRHVKISVSELKRRYEIADEEAAPAAAWQRPPLLRPSFIQEKSGLSGAEMGSAIHLMLQHVDFKKPANMEHLQELKTGMVEKALLSPEAALNIDLSLVQGFLQSELGRRLQKAEQIWRELPFSLRLAAEEFYGSDCRGEFIYIQGIIDCVAREKNQAILIDFKSDNVSTAGLLPRSNSYKVQVEMYSRAITSLLGLEVKERHLYFLRLGQTVSI